MNKNCKKSSYNEDSKVNNSGENLEEFNSANSS